MSEAGSAVAASGMSAGPVADPDDAPTAVVDWSIVVFARNEAVRIAECLRAIGVACRGRRAHVTLLINGSRDGSLDAAIAAAAAAGVPTAVHAIAHGCKSNAINVFVHGLRPPAGLYLFVDATAFVEPDAFARMDATVHEAGVDATSGVPANGRGARAMAAMAREGAPLFGQMFALSAAFVERWAASGIRLPVGLYRGDGLISGLVAWDLDPVGNPERASRIRTAPGARWRIRSLSPWRVADLRRGLERQVRQARGRLENLSWNAIIWTRGFGALPRYADDMICQWLDGHAVPREGLRDRLFTRLAIRAARRGVRPDEDSLRPRLVRRIAAAGG